jgi:FtsH-binding integral membrane protein
VGEIESLTVAAAAILFGVGLLVYFLARGGAKRLSRAVPILAVTAFLLLIVIAANRSGMSSLDWYAYAAFFALPAAVGGGLGLMIAAFRGDRQA